MKTKISLILAAVALVTLSFTFVNVSPESSAKPTNTMVNQTSEAPIGGLIEDEVVK